MRALLISMAVALALAGCGTSADCKSACDTLKGCAISSSGVSCDAKCAGDDATCAQCISAKTCVELKSGACKKECPKLGI